MRKPSSRKSSWVSVDVLAEAVLDWARGKKYVRALFSYGSYARGEHTPSSDLDLCLLLKPGRVAAKLDSLYASLPADVKWRCDTNGKSVAYLGENMVKLDMIVANTPAAFAWLIDHPDIAEPRLSLLHAKGAGFSRELRAASRPLNRDSLALVEEEALKFFTYFEACSRSQRRSDSYQYYFQYNLALGSLTRIFHILESKDTPRYLFCPKSAFSNFGGKRVEEGKEWIALAGTLYLPEANQAKRRLVEMYQKLMARARARFGPKVSARTADAELLEEVMKRDFFFNVRDFARAYGGKVRHGRLFRASALPRWKGQPELKEFLTEHRISNIIDLRKPSELAKDDGRLDYDPPTLAGLNYANVPVGGGEHFGEGGEYMRCLMSNLAPFARALESIARAKGSTVIHCHVGKDRTGIACALIACLLDQPRKQIIDDYLLSEQGVSHTKMEVLLNDMDKAGGAERLLQKVGFDIRHKRLLQRKLLLKP
jgi:predicted nucleotidyltransferase